MVLGSRTIEHRDERHFLARLQKLPRHFVGYYPAEGIAADEIRALGAHRFHFFNTALRQVRDGRRAAVVEVQIGESEEGLGFAKCARKRIVGAAHIACPFEAEEGRPGAGFDFEKLASSPGEGTQVSGGEACGDPGDRGIVEEIRQGQVAAEMLIHPPDHLDGQE